MTRILGIDPGSHITGYGLIEAEGREPRCLDCNTIRPRRGLDLPDRLHVIHRSLSAIIAEHCPDVVAVETAFYHKSARSTLVLGQVHGVVLLAAREADVPVDQYAPREIKVAVTGSGAALKEQVAYMVRGLLGLTEIPPLDASDALAVALCHWHRSQARTVP
jgi:crossover junction endodeoxyribonuclease RuvC